VSAERLGASFDLLAAWQEGGTFFERDGLGVATGPGESVAVGDVPGILRERPDGAVAGGVLPFEGEGPLIVGDAQVRRTDPFVTARVGEIAQPVLVTGLIPAAAFADAELTNVPIAAV
jgi:hypothetical protein